MRHLCLMLLTYLALILDADAGTWSLPVGTAPSFLFLVAATAVLLLEGAGAVWWAVVVGVLTDSLSRGLMGLNVVVLANLVFFVQIFGCRMLRDSAFAGGAFVWGFVTLASLSCVILRHSLLGNHIDWFFVTMDSAGRAGGSALLFLLVVLSWRILCKFARLVFPTYRVRGNRGGWAARGV